MSEAAATLQRLLRESIQSQVKSAARVEALERSVLASVDQDRVMSAALEDLTREVKRLTELESARQAAQREAERRRAAERAEAGRWLREVLRHPLSWALMVLAAFVAGRLGVDLPTPVNVEVSDAAAP